MNLSLFYFAFNRLVTFRENVHVKGIFLVKVGNQTFYHNLGVLNPINPVPK